jgi:glycosyltransferase involved in cell wall biosynthesis
MRVLQLISSGGYYGAESMLLNLSLELEKAATPTDLVLFYNVHQPNVELYERARMAGISVRMVRCKGRFDLSAISEVRDYIRQDKIDIVHTHGYKADLYGFAAARLEKKPVVATCHNWLDGDAALSIYNRLDRMVLKKFNAIAAVSEAVGAKLKEAGVEGDRISTVANGIDVDRFSGLASQPRLEARATAVVGMVGRLDLQKGFEFLLPAIAELRKEFPGIKLVVAGEGPDRAAIAKMISDLSLQSSVELLGQCGDMPSVYAGIDIFVLPSLNEGLPMTVLEAMAAGKPVIATRVGAIPSVLKQGETGLLVNPADRNELREALRALLSHPDMAKRLATNGNTWVRQEYTSAAMAARYQEIYKSVLAERTAEKRSSAATLKKVGA